MGVHIIVMKGETQQWKFDTYFHCCVSSRIIFSLKKLFMVHLLYVTHCSFPHVVMIKGYWIVMWMSAYAPGYFVRGSTHLWFYSA